MVFIEERRFGGEPAFEKVLQRVIVGFKFDPAVPCRDAHRVAVGDKFGKVTDVEQDAVRGFGPHAVDAEQFFSQRVHVAGEHCFERAVVLFDDQPQEIPQSLGFHLIIAGRANELAEFFRIERVNLFRRRHARFSQVVDRLLDVAPVRILHEHRADQDFQRPFARPPMLRSVALEQAVESVLHGCRQGKTPVGARMRRTASL